MLPKLVITDIDGVWTDGGMYYDQTGNEWKKFNTSDSAGVLFLRKLNIPVAIITGENTAIVANRAKKLKIDLLFQGISDKVNVAQQLCANMNISMSDIAFIGDDIGDLGLLQLCGTAGSPANASDYIKKHAHIVTQKAGGEGAFREFVETILQREGVFEALIEGLTNDSKTV